MTATQKYLPLFQSQKNISLLQTGGFRNFLTNMGDSLSSNKKIIKFSPQKILQEIEKIEWRKKTEFPIVKIIEYKQHKNVFSSNQKYPSKKILIQVTVQSILYNLTEVDQIPIFKMLYVLKQTLVAAERLCSLYGNFIFKPSMIGIDSKKKVKIWHNSKFYLNVPEIPCKSQLMTLKSMIDMFYLKTKKSSKMIKFYHQLQKCTNFCQCLNILKKFTSEEKLRIPSLFLLVDSFSSNMCSPRKFISRQPSDQKNSSTSIQKKCKKMNISPQKKTNTQRSRISPPKNSTQNNIKTLTFNRKDHQKCPSQKINLTSRTRAYTDFSISQKTQPNMKMTSLKFKKLNDLFIPKNRLLNVIESVFEGDSDSRFSDDFGDQPRIRIYEPMIQTNDKQDTPPCRSSGSLDQTNPETVNYDCFISSKQAFQIPTDNKMQPQRRKLGRVKTYHPSIRYIDE